MSTYSSEAAEQVVRMTLEGSETAIRLAGSGARQLAVLLYAVLRDQKKTKGKTRLTSMLRSGRELKVFAVRDEDMRKFGEEARKYGVLYTVLKDRDANDGLTDVMVRAEDAGKINRIFERFHLATVDVGVVKTESGRGTDGKDEPWERAVTQKQKVDDYLEDIMRPESEETERKTGDPAKARTAEFHPSGLSSTKRPNTERDVSGDPHGRPSVKRQLEEIQRERRKTAETPVPDRERQHRQHRAPEKTNRTIKEEMRA